MGDIWIKQNHISNISNTPLTNQKASSKGTLTGNAPGAFGEILRQKLEPAETNLVFSKHAARRLHDRDIEMSSEQISTLAGAVDKAAEKGIKNALILGSDHSFIVNVPSKTVVTIMNHQNMKENVVTNIDGTVII